MNVKNNELKLLSKCKRNFGDQSGGGIGMGQSWEGIGTGWM